MTYLDEPVASKASTPFELHAGALRLALRPDLGGAVAGLWHGTTPILRSSEPAALSTARDAAMYPLVPYSNRLGYRHFRWRGQDYTTRANVADSPHSLHGLGWQRPWRIVSSSALEVVLELVHEGDADWPFAFTARQYFSLSADSLGVRLQLTNDAGVEQPVGLGLHPYFVEARAQPAPHRALASLGQRRDAPADAQGRSARNRQRSLASRLRQLLRRLARPGADPRRALLAPADLVAAIPGRLHAARARLLLRRAGKPRQQCDPHGRPGRARPGRAGAGSDARRLAEARHRRRLR